MVLSLNDHKALLSGFQPAGFAGVQQATSAHNPIRIDWLVNGNVNRFRLWSFDITHGGGGAEVRAADEFRIQITNGPGAVADFDTGGTTDLLVGYQHCAEKHLHRYLSEFDFRYSNRIALGVNDGERRTLAIKGAAGKRLTYRGRH